MLTWNPDCRLRLRLVRCSSGTPCAGFKPAFFGARGLVLEPGGKCRLVYAHDWWQEAA